jgi:hypothetical protein
MLNTKENLKQIEMDTIQQEPLFTELAPEAAATVEGGVATFLFETKNVTSRLNIRQRPSLGSRIISYWYPDQKKRMKTPPITKNGFRAFGTGVPGWVSTQFIKLVPGTYRPN